MEFDKSKVYTTFDADEVKIGSKGYFADAKEYLITHVKFEDKDFYGTLDEIRHNSSELPFSTNESVYRYFYLVEEPEEPTKRSCTREELIEMLKKQGLPMLLRKDNDTVYTFVYLQSKTLTAVSSLSQRYIHYTYEELCAEFTLLDGTELWVKE